MGKGGHSGTLAGFGWPADEFVGGDVEVKALLVHKAVAFGMRNSHWVLVLCPSPC